LRRFLLVGGWHSVLSFSWSSSILSMTTCWLSASNGFQTAEGLFEMTAVTKTLRLRPTLPKYKYLYKTGSTGLLNI
jgi:hypothetical protein